MRDRKLKPIHTYKCVFVHIPKCGGTSIEGALKINASHEPIKNYQGPDDYFKFTFVRNPWERLVSLYFYFRDTVNEIGYWKDMYRSNKLRSMCNNFYDFCHLTDHQLHRIHPRHFLPILYYIEHNSKVGVDFIGKFENFQEDFNIVCDKIGIPYQELPHKNKSKHKHYTEYYDEETKQIVAEKYAKDIEHFGYKFGE